MKTKLALLSLLLASQAGAADFYITGATAFRAAAVKAICGAFSSTGFVAGYSGASSSLTASSRSVFRGSFNGIAGTTTIYCSWNGSVEGIRALANNEDIAFLSTAPTQPADPLTATGGSDLGSATSMAKAQLAFSDVYKSSTPYGTATLFPTGGDSNVGVVAFAWVAHEGSAAGLTNITTQSARAIFTQGFQPLRLFTGLTADDNKYVFLTGRNDGSGTRTTFLAETGYPITQAIHQYKAVSDGTTLTSLRVWPLNDGSNASLNWNPDLEGNGGYSSGGDLTNVLKATSGASVPVYEADGTTPAFDPAPVSVLGYQSTKDAYDSFVGGGRLLSYNGFPVSYTSTDISAATRQSIINGQYTMWGYEHLYSRTAINFNTPANDLDRLYRTIRLGCTAANLGNSGIPLSEMSTISRSSDGGIVAP